MSDALPAFLTAEWRFLVMMNFEINPKLLEPLVPAGTELDFWNGQTYVSIVGFRFLNTKVRGLSIPFHRHFSEVNLRFYVRRQTGREWRRGVVFIKEIVPRPAVTLVARWIYNENYITLPMRHKIELSSQANALPGSIEYSWKSHGKWSRLSADVTGSAHPHAMGSQEEFITEHYWGYTRQRDGTTMEYGVEHPPWRAWQTTSSRLDCDTAALYGLEFAPILVAQPASTFVAEGSEIVVRQGTRLP